MPWPMQSHAGATARRPRAVRPLWQPESRPRGPGSGRPLAGSGDLCDGPRL